MTKICNKCKQEFPKTLEYFYKRGKYLRPYCKTCNNKANAEWQKANPEKEKAARKTWREANREKVNAASKSWRDRNPEKKKEVVAAWRNRNPEKVKATRKAWDKANSDKVRANSRKQRALKAGNIHEDWTEQELFETYGTDCYLCNLPIDFNAPRTGIGSDYSSWPDHKTPTSRGGSNILENVRPCHRKCNESKRNKTYEEYILTVNSQDIVTIK